MQLYSGPLKTNPSGGQTAVLNLGLPRASPASWQLGHAVSVLANDKMPIFITKASGKVGKIYKYYEESYLLTSFAALPWSRSTFVERISCNNLPYANQRNFKTANCLECLITTIDSKNDCSRKWSSKISTISAVKWHIESSHLQVDTSHSGQQFRPKFQETVLQGRSHLRKYGHVITTVHHFLAFKNALLTPLDSTLTPFLLGALETFENVFPA